MMNLSEASPEFEAILSYLNDSQGIDLSGYKRSSLMRRFQHRMQALNIGSYENYLEYLKSHSEEYVSLLNDVLINVTRFFRDPETWDYLNTQVLSELLASKSADEQIRVWSAGCAAGQEVCSLLILLAEKLGIEACVTRVRCYATDIDEPALKEARRGIYSDRDIIEISPDLLAKYFKHTERGYIFNPDLHRTIVFGRHNLMRDAPISKIDLLLCRNVLIYFNPEAQASVLVRFHFALKDTGYLFLGRAETLLNRRPIFMPVNFKHRIYTKGLPLALEDHLSINPKSRKSIELPASSYFWQTAFQRSPVAQFAIDLEGYLIDMNEQALIVFECTGSDRHRLFRELEPGKLVSSYLGNHYIQAICLQGIVWRDWRFEVMIVPVFNARKERLGTVVTFVEQTD
jgi:two-component system, chemotaxis family, CheB/CheR fusion protein